MKKTTLFISTYIFAFLASKPVFADIPLGDALPFGIGKYKSIGDVISQLMLPALSIFGLGIFFYIVSSGFKILTNPGDKDVLNKARESITHALIALFILIMIFLVMEFLPTLTGLNFGFLK